MMVRIMPDWLVENYKLLEEKLQDIILMRRGLLIPHPRDEYDLLEERILESLELKAPRLLKCGHFIGPEDDTDKEDECDEASLPDDNTGRGSRMSGGTFTEEQEWKDGMEDPDASMCSDCHHEVKRPGKGIGAGKRRWQVKIYAANGLMPANAWTACWNDMERCDVEISPWIPDELRKTFERRIVEEEEAVNRKHLYALELQRQIQDAALKQKIVEEEEAERKRLDEAERLERSVEEKEAEKKRFEDAVEEKIAEAKEEIRLELEAQAMVEADSIAERLRALEESLKEPKKTASEGKSLHVAPSRQLRTADIPLSTLLKNYILVLLKDQRNIIILVLGALVVFLAMNMGTAPAGLQLPTIAADVEPVHTVAVTTTATTTATLTVTEVQTAMSMQETALPVFGEADPVAFVADKVASQMSSAKTAVAQAFGAGAKDDSVVPPAVEEGQDIFEPVSTAISDPTDHSDTPRGFCPLTNIFASPLPHCAA
jgi:hypothetical protein